MNESPSFSIVTPSLNQRRFLGTAISSVAGQNHLRFEHTVMDAQSQDGTCDVLRSYSHLKQLRWTSEPDEGQTDAINKGFKLSNGDILAWLNADDYYLPGAFEKVSRAFEAYPEIDVVYGEAVFVDENGNRLRIKRDHAFDYGTLLYYGCYIMSTATFFRRKIIDDGIFLDPSYQVQMDYEYFLRLASLGYRFGFIPAPLAAFRWHGSNVSIRLHERRRQERLMVQRQYGGFAWLKNDALRVKCFDGLARVYQGKRVVRRAIERWTGARRKPLL